MEKIEEVSSEPLITLLDAAQEYNTAFSDPSSSHAEMGEATASLLRASRRISPGELAAYRDSVRHA